MSKSPLPPDDDAPPPSYTDSPPSYSSSTLSPPIPPPPQPVFSLQAVLNPLSSHLRTLPGRIRETNAIVHNLQTDRDLDVLSYILPHVEGFLLSSDIAAAGAGVAQLVVVPLDAVPGAWGLSEVDERRKTGEIIRVGRVDVGVDGREDGAGDEKGGGGGEGRGDEKGSGKKEKQREFDDWGRWVDEGESSDDAAARAFWWRDEGMARRLAGYLQPKETVKTERREVRAEVQKEKEKKGLFGWGRKGSDKRPAEVVSVGDKGPVGPVMPETEGVSMVVRAKEVTFRKENEFGVWESLSGFGVVVTIRVRRT